jgi:hypothetical protein
LAAPGAVAHDHAMRKAMLATLTMATLATGCSAAKSAIGTLTGSKPNQVTVVTNVEPAPVTVNVAAPVPAPTPAPVEKKSSRLSAAAKGTIAGLVVGGAIGLARNGTSKPSETGKLLLIGAGAGAAAGVAVHEASK